MHCHGQPMWDHAQLCPPHRCSQPPWTRCSSTARAACRATTRPCCCWRGCSACSRIRQTSRAWPSVSVGWLGTGAGWPGAWGGPASVHLTFPPLCRQAVHREKALCLVDWHLRLTCCLACCARGAGPSLRTLQGGVHVLARLSGRACQPWLMDGAESAPQAPGRATGWSRGDQAAQRGVSCF